MKFTNRKHANDFYRDVMFDAELDGCVEDVMANLGKNDLFFLLTRILKRNDIQHDWLFERCTEVQNEPNGCLDLWHREARKSTIITFALTIQDLMWDPELTIGIFSITRPLAKDFLEQIKRELEDNELLKTLYPDSFWQDPKNQAPKWSLDDGIILKRKSNPRESTVEAFGLIEGLPTGKHFQIRVYDDVIDEKNVTNPEIIKKATERWELSTNLGSNQIVARYGQANLERYIGTRYHYNDPYAEMMKRGTAKPRIYPATENGEPKGKSVYFEEELLAKKRRDMGPYVFACQMLLDPKADEVQGFEREWIRHWYPKDWGLMNIYIVVDPASSKKKGSDYTVMWVIGLGRDGNYYKIDGIRDRLNLTQRTEALFRLHRLYNPLGVGYEQYGMQSDIEHIQYVMDQDNYRFVITPLGGRVSKNDRIKRLIPVYEQGRFYQPRQLIYVDHEKQSHDLTHHLVENELLAFPVSQYDDAMDCEARILDPDLNAKFPKPEFPKVFPREHEMCETEYDIWR